MRSYGALAWITIATAAGAQASPTTLGPWGDIHYTSASGTSTDDSVPFQHYPISTTASSGGGVTIGYGFTSWLSAYATVDAAGSQTITPSLPAISGTLDLTQVDAGARVQLPLAKGRVVPYALIAYSSRLLRGPVTTQFYGDGTFSTWGGAVTYGGGAEIFLAAAFALDVSYQRSVGSYGRLQFPNGATFPTHASNATSSRTLVGITWSPGPLTPEADPTRGAAAPLSNGQEVRVRAGTTVLTGTVIYLGRDTLIIQRIVKDQPVQSAIPLACLQTVARHREPPPPKVDLVNGSVIGAIGGGLVGAVASSQGTHTPRTAGSFALSYLMGGAVVGFAAGAVVNHEADSWEGVPLPKAPAMEIEERQALCRSWSPPG